MIARLLAKARQALTTAQRDLDNADADAAANRAYYAGRNTCSCGCHRSHLGPHRQLEIKPERGHFHDRHQPEG